MGLFRLRRSGGRSSAAASSGVAGGVSGVVSRGKPVKAGRYGGFRDFLYSRFWWLGKAVLSSYPTLVNDVRTAGMTVHPEVYACIAGFAFFVTVLVCIGAMVFAAVMMTLVGLPLMVFIVVVAAGVITPFVVLVLIGSGIPRGLASSRRSGLDLEVPFATAYLTVIASSGMTPYAAFERLRGAPDIFKRLAKYASRFAVLVGGFGKDPLTALDDIASRCPSNMFRELLFGYAATIRAGGDVVDYLNKRAQTMFAELISRIKAAGERLASLLESYLAIVLLVLLTLNAIYMVNLSIAEVSLPGLGGPSLFLFSFVLLPFLSGVMMYLADALQYKEPLAEWRPYIAFFGLTLPIAVFLTFLTVIPLYFPKIHPFYRAFSPIANIFLAPAIAMGVDEAFYPAFNLALVWLIATIPSAIYEVRVSAEHKGVLEGVTMFLRDLVEIRKTGLSPEKSIIQLSSRNYGRFTKYLKQMSAQLALGVALGKIFQRLVKRIKTWRTRVFLFILTDAIEVGGGTIETLESMALFAELADTVEKERRSSLKVLLVVPYIGAAMLISAITLLAAFMSGLAMGVAAYKEAVMMILPATVFNCYFMGLIAGKVSAGTVAAGFKHAAMLMLVCFLVLLASPLFKAMAVSISGVTP